MSNCNCKFHRYYECSSSTGCNKEVLSLFLETSITGNVITYKVTNKGTCMYFGIISVCSSLLGTIKKEVTLEVNDSFTVNGDVTKAIYYEGKNKNDNSIAYLKVKKGVYVYSNEVETITANNTYEDDPEIQPGPVVNIPSGPISGTWIYSVTYANYAQIPGVDFFTFINSPMSTSNATNIKFTIMLPVPYENYSFESTYSTVFDYVKIGNVVVVSIPLLEIGEIETIAFRVTDTSVSTMKYIVHVESETPLEWQPRATVIDKL